MADLDALGRIQLDYPRVDVFPTRVWKRGTSFGPRGESGYLVQALRELFWSVDRAVFRGKFRSARDRSLAVRAAKEEDSALESLRASNPYALETLYNRAPHNLLSELCDTYGSDKGETRPDGHPYPWRSHTYADYISRMFAHCRNSVTRVFECGIGTNNPNLVSTMGISGKPGASLRVWRDYFPNAIIYGADIDEDILFSEERITTFQVDQTNPGSVRGMWEKIGGKVDLIIDDGLHAFEAGKTLFENSIDRLEDNGVYIIEDVFPSDLRKYEKFFSNTGYFVDFAILHRENSKLKDNCLVVIRKEL